MISFAKKEGVEEPIFIKTSEELIKYIQTKNTTSPSTQTSQARKDDLVTSMAIFSHGLVGGITLGLRDGSEIADGTFKDDPGVFSTKEVQKLSASSFDCKFSEIDIYSCNSATPWATKGQSFSSNEALTKYGNENESLVSFMAKITGATVSGYFGKTDYSNVNSGVFAFCWKYICKSCIS
ncbi:MAG: hypothetical protein WCK02_14295 [Bacteroidota bacterium]